MEMGVPPAECFAFSTSLLFHFLLSEVGWGDGDVPIQPRAALLGAAAVGWNRHGPHAALLKAVGFCARSCISFAAWKVMPRHRFF